MSKYYVKNGLVHGRICHTPSGCVNQGWTYLPFTSSRQASRKAWPTPEAAVASRISGGQIIEANSFLQAQEIADSLRGGAR